MHAGTNHENIPQRFYGVNAHYFLLPHSGFTILSPGPVPGPVLPNHKTRASVLFPYGRQSVHLADEIWARLEILKACCRSTYSIFRFV